MSQKFDAYKEALEKEIKKWTEYERVLRGENKHFFAELMNMARSFEEEASSTNSTIIFQPMMMSIILAQNKRINRIAEELSKIKLPDEATKGEAKQVEDIIDQPKSEPVPKKMQRGLFDFV